MRRYGKVVSTVFENEVKGRYGNKKNMKPKQEG